MILENKRSKHSYLADKRNFIEKLKKYDGMMLHKRFAYRYLGDQCNPIGDIIVFRGEMEVLSDGMIDQEDVLNQAFIWSKDALNILWELPILGNNSYGAVCYQRLFNSKIAELLSQKCYLNQNVITVGDDIYIESAAGQFGKASVSITHVKDHAALGHTGINIDAGNKAPAIAFSTQLTDEQIEYFIEDVIKLFYEMNHDIFIATTKILAK